MLAGYQNITSTSIRIWSKKLQYIENQVNNTEAPSMEKQEKYH